MKRRLGAARARAVALDVALAIAFALSPGRLLAAEEEGGHAATFLGVPLTIWQAVNLVLFIVLLVWLVRKPLAKALGGRTATIAEALRKADEQKKRADNLEAQLKGRLTELEKDLEELKARSTNDVEADRKTFAAETDAEVGRIVARATADLDARVRTARGDLTKHAGDLAVDLAREIVRREITPEDQKRLVTDGVRDIAAPARRAS